MQHPKAIGDRSTLAILTALQAVGCGLYLPFGENTRCDLVIERDGRIGRLQCKTGRLREGAVRFSACSNYGHHQSAKHAQRDYRGDVDYFAVYCLETAGVYLIPMSDLQLTREAALRVDPPRNNQRRRIRLAADYEIGRVAIGELRASSGA